MEEEVAAVEDDEVDHAGHVKIGGVLRGREPQQLLHTISNFTTPLYLLKVLRNDCQRWNKIFLKILT